MGPVPVGRCAVRFSRSTAGRAFSLSTLNSQLSVMAEDRNKIAQELTDEQLDQFIQELAALPKKNRRLVDIQEKAAALGITASLMSAKAFRDTTFERHLQRIRTFQEVAMQVEGIESGGNTMANAAGKLLSKRIFSQLMEAEETGDEVDVDAMTLSVSRLRKGDVNVAGLELRVRDYERREREREEKNAAAAAQLQKLRDPNAGLNETERTAILDEVDRLMGVKK